jgi:hypothetical protein
LSLVPLTLSPSSAGFSSTMKMGTVCSPETSRSYANVHSMSFKTTVTTVTTVTTSNVTEMNITNSEIRGPHGSDCDEQYSLGCDTVQSCRLSTFRKVLLPFSWL